MVQPEDPLFRPQKTIRLGIESGAPGHDEHGGRSHPTRLAQHGPIPITELDGAALPGGRQHPPDLRIVGDKHRLALRRLPGGKALVVMGRRENHGGFADRQPSKMQMKQAGETPCSFRSEIDDYA